MPGAVPTDARKRYLRSRKGAAVRDRDTATIEKIEHVAAYIDAEDALLAVAPTLTPGEANHLASIALGATIERLLHDWPPLTAAQSDAIRTAAQGGGQR